MSVALLGWTLVDGIWTGPFPFTENDSVVRMCANCGEHFSLCNGAVKIGDILPALQGKPLTRFPRELCFWCATTQCYWDGETLVRGRR